MPRKKNEIPFFTDQNVPDSVGAALVAAGHKVTKLREIMDPSSPDPVVAAACASGGFVLITHDLDFKKLAKKLAVTQRDYRDTLSRITLRCPEPKSAERLKAVIPFIEKAWALRKKGKPMIVEVTDVGIRIEH